MSDTNITKFTSLDIIGSETPVNGFFVPALTTVQRDAIPASIIRDGALIYNLTATMFQVRVNGVWSAMHSSVTTASVVGLAAGNSPFMLPSGTAAAVEVAANQYNGFMYYNTTANNIRARVNGAWVAVTVA